MSLALHVAQTDRRIRGTAVWSTPHAPLQREETIKKITWLNKQKNQMTPAFFVQILRTLKKRQI